MIKNVSKLLFLCTLSLMIVGCWDYNEIETIEFVLGSGVDQLDPDFVVVVEMVKPSGTEEVKSEAIVLSTEGRSFLSSGRALRNPTGLTLFWPHAQVFIVSEEVAREGIIPAMEFMVRSSNLRTTISLFVARDCTVEEIFNSKPLIAETVSQHLIGIVEMHEQIPTFYPQEMWKFRKEMNQCGFSSSAPTIQLVHERGELVPIVKGTALFKGEQMVGWLDGEESRIFSLLKGKADRGVLVVNTTIEGYEGLFTYEIMTNQTKIKPVVEGDSVAMSITVELWMGLFEVGTAEVNFLDPELVQDLERQVSATVKHQIHGLLSKIQREYTTDALGFGLLLKRKHPQIWRAYSENWEEVLPNLDVTVEVESRIVATGLLLKSTQPRY